MWQLAGHSHRAAVCPLGKVLSWGLLIGSAVNITQVTLIVESGVSSTKSVKHAWVSVPDGAIRSLKFIDDEFIMLALVEPGGKLCFHCGWKNPLIAMTRCFPAGEDRL